MENVVSLEQEQLIKLVKFLLEDPIFGKVSLFIRREVDLKHENWIFIYRL